MDKTQAGHGFATGRAVLFAVVLAAFSTPADAQTVEQFYQGKTSTILVPADPGGSYDLYARLLGRFLPKYIPGNPSAVVQNMVGGAGVRELNYLYTVAPKDGTVMGMPLQDSVLNEALGEAGGKYKSADFGWVGRLSYSVDITVTWHTSRVKTVADAQKISIPIAATGPTSPTVIDHAVSNYLLGTKYKIIPGYKAMNDMLGALERGEVEGSFGSWTTLKAAHPDWITQKKVNILVVYAGKRFEELPDVPAIVEFAKTPQDRSILELFGSSGFVGRSFAATPGVPPERLAALRKAFGDMIKDPDFLDALKKTKADYGPLSGEEMQRFAESLRAPDPAIIARAKLAMKIPGQ